METKASQVTDKIVEIEQEVETGMEKAKEEVKVEMKEEMREREERATNVVVYGVKESEETDPEKRKKHDAEKVKEMAAKIGVTTGELEVKFRAGKKNDAANSKPRPMIVRVEDDETRENILRNARRLAREEEWKTVFVSEDLTWKQREEAKAAEKKLREEAEKKTEKAKNEGKSGGKYVVVGPRGRRRVVWRNDEKPAAE